jgi:UDP-3-O-[3-hydroxymyristoyl] glucosamine N-acyltransferase
MQKLILVSLQDISEWVGGTLLSSGSEVKMVRAIAPLNRATKDEVAFLAQTKYREQLVSTNAAVVLLSQKDLDWWHHAYPTQALHVDAIVVDNPYAAYAKVATQFVVRQQAPLPLQKIHPSAVVDERARLADDVVVGANAVIEANAVIGAGTRIGPGCVVGEGVVIGESGLLHANVTIYHGCQLGARVILHSGVVIGSDGYGFAPEHGAWLKIPQVGVVIVGDDVEVGANTCIDRGALDATVIGNGVKIDNLSQIAHNVQVGDHTLISANAAIAGSTSIGKHCMIGGGTCIVGHIKIVDGVSVSGATVVTRALTKPGVYTGILPFMEHAQWERNAPVFRHLRELREKIRRLEKNK